MSVTAQGLRHPCFDKDAHHHFGRMHVPVAKSCNVQCAFCDRRYACVNESRPGVTARLLTPEEAVAAAVRTAQGMPHLSVVGIAGPRDPLADAMTTLRTLQALRHALPDILLCLSTNGLALPLFADTLAELGVGHVTVTVNAVAPAVGASVYAWVENDGIRIDGEEGAALLRERQEAGIRRLKAHGVTVKVNTVVIPGINAHHVGEIAQAVSRWGADLMNCIPLLPVAGTALAHVTPPGPALMERLRGEAAPFIPQMRHCARCRADAAGMLGDSGRIQGLRAPAGGPQACRLS